MTRVQFEELQRKLDALSEEIRKFQDIMCKPRFLVNGVAENFAVTIHAPAGGGGKEKGPEAEASEPEYVPENPAV